MIQFPKPYADAVARLRVPSGFLIVLVFAWLSRPSPVSIVWGVPVSLLGLALRGWAAGCLDKNRQLSTGGPYAHTRNPLYLGTLAAAAGLAIAARSPWLAVLFACVFLFVYLPVIQLEEQHLRHLFPEYESYAARVGALWPRLTPDPGSIHAAFRFRLYLQNQEYQAGAGFAAGLLYLLWRLPR
ncbi:MAG: methyltransferase [Bryobacteraceae bacterium]|jgi:protein-S-isoprenylcysteine O-methyltransferase Ste14